MSVAIDHTSGYDPSNKQEETGYPSEQIVVFSLGEEQFGIDIAKVQEIIRWQRVTKVPNAPHFVEGVINLRGRIVPVADLRRRFELESLSPDKETRIIVVEISGLTVGMVVDSVSEVLLIPGTAIEPPSPIITTSASTHLRGIARLEDRLIALLNVDQLLALDSEIAA